MMSSTGITKRRRNNAGDALSDEGITSNSTSHNNDSNHSSSNDLKPGAERSWEGEEDYDDADGKSRGKEKLTILEEVLLLGLKDSQVYTLFNFPDTYLYSISCWNFF
jgi:hypothetical protein